MKQNNVIISNEHSLQLQSLLNLFKNKIFDLQPNKRLKRNFKSINCLSNKLIPGRYIKSYTPFKKRFIY